MKLILQILVSIVLHPIAVILAWINIAGRSDLRTLHKLIWALVVLVWGLGPILYITIGSGTLW